jgi:hypothetical protein
LACALQEINTPGSTFITKRTGFSKNEKLQYQSKACESLTKIHLLTHYKNKLLIQRSWLNIILFWDSQRNLGRL